jgi:hypothetical protein
MPSINVLPAWSRSSAVCTAARAQMPMQNMPSASSYESESAQVAAKNWQDKELSFVEGKGKYQVRFIQVHLFK